MPHPRSRWITIRAGVVWFVMTFVLMAALLIFIRVGWPAGADECVTKSPDECYCEYFRPSEAESGAPGVRQPTNTWSNLYAIGTSLFVALMICFDRYRVRFSKNVMKSTWWVPDVYVFAVLFLGLGSMWLHASLSKWVSWMDGLSMYVFAAFLVFYTLDRWFAQKGVTASTRNLVFAIGYPLTTIAFTVIGALGVPSELLIGILVIAYAILEFGFAGFLWKPWPLLWWMLGAWAMQNAVVFWLLSQTDKPLCDPHDWFQPHGLLWHTLAGVMAVMMYLYWREEYSGDEVIERETNDRNTQGPKDDSGWA